LFLRFKIVGQIPPIDFPLRNKSTKIVLFVELAKKIFDVYILFLKMKVFVVYHFALICLHIRQKG